VVPVTPDRHSLAGPSRQCWCPRLPGAPLFPHGCQPLRESAPPRPTGDGGKITSTRLPASCSYFLAAFGDRRACVVGRPGIVQLSVLPAPRRRARAVIPGAAPVPAVPAPARAPIPDPAWALPGWAAAPPGCPASSHRTCASHRRSHAGLHLRGSAIPPADDAGRRHVRVVLRRPPRGLSAGAGPRLSSAPSVRERTGRSGRVLRSVGWLLRPVVLFQTREPRWRGLSARTPSRSPSRCDPRVPRTDGARLGGSA
jgi:hypothetical protein